MRGRSIDRITFFLNSFFSFEFCSFEKSVNLLFFPLNSVLSKIGSGWVRLGQGALEMLGDERTD